MVLEAFQGEIGRRILRLSKSHSLLSTCIALQLQSIASRILSHKLNGDHTGLIDGPASKGFNFPMKAPREPKEKKARLALAMAS